MDDVFASIASGVLTTNLEHKITLTNSVAEKLLGQSQADLIGQSVSQVPIFKAINLQSYLTMVCQSSQQMHGLQFNFPSPNNTVLHFRLTWHP